MNDLPAIPDVVLDLGCGAGSHFLMRPGNLSVIGIDRSFKMLLSARKQRTPFDGVVADVRHLPIKGDTTRFLTAIGLLEYISDRDSVLKEIKHVLCPEGSFLFTFAQSNIWNYLRNALGSRIHTFTTQTCLEWLLFHRFHSINHKHSMMQTQYLVYNNKE